MPRCYFCVNKKTFCQSWWIGIGNQKNPLLWIKAADYIIDIGPEGGDAGGRVVAVGSPREMLGKTQKSYTARYLEKYLQQR